MKTLLESCQEICDKYNAIHSAVYEWFNISTDHFGRTSTDKQREIVHEIFNDLDKNDMLCEKEVQQLYSPELPGFLADRFVEGTCPKESFQVLHFFILHSAG